MFELVQFEPDHLLQFSNYGNQEHLVKLFSPDELLHLKIKGPAFTAIMNGIIVGCAGVVEINPFRAVAWGLFQKTGTSAFLGIHRATANFLKNCTYRRIEAYVDPKSPAAMKWIQLLGFKLDKAYTPYFFPNGSGASTWAYYP